MNLTLSDKTGTITGMMFSNGKVNERSRSIQKGDICRVIGYVKEYEERLNIRINRIVKCSKEEYELEDFIRVSEKDRNDLVFEIDYAIENIKDDSLKNLLKSFFKDENFTNKFYKSPCAKRMHHDYIGGLLEHTVSVLRICKIMHDLYTELDADLLYTGAILHDIGKLKAYNYAQLVIEISEEGYLLDHMFIGCNMIEEKLKKIEMPSELSNKLLHLVLSHHGEVKNGWGSSVDPKIPEAVALHHADNMDAKVKGILQTFPTTE